MGRHAQRNSKPRHNKRNLNVVFFDLETTGFDKPIRPVQIGAVDSWGKNVFNMFVWPRRHIHPKATLVNNFYAKKGELYRHSERLNCVDLEDALIAFLDWLVSLGGNVILVAHKCLDYDAKVLLRNFEEFGITYSDVIVGFSDSLLAARQLYTDVSSHKLSTMLETVGCLVREEHDALQALREGKRLDGRGWMDTRDLDISFGTEWGTCQVTQGKTRVLAHVSCQVTEPRRSRPSEGMLIINVELSPIAAPRFEAGRSSEELVEINRTLGRCLMEIVAQVWAIRLDLHVLNDEGSLADACSVAGIAALSHFRRPDVTVKGGLMTVHPINERDPVPLAVHHHPVATTFGMFKIAENSETLTVCEPGRLEEDVMMGKMVIGVNAFREVCTLHLAGQVLVDKNLVSRLVVIAAEKSKRTVDKIKTALAQEEEARKTGIPRGFVTSLQKISILQSSAKKKILDLSNIEKTASATILKTECGKTNEVQVNVGDKGATDFVEIVPTTLKNDNSDSEESVEMVDVESSSQRPKVKPQVPEDLDDSEEEETITLTNIS